MTLAQHNEIATTQQKQNATDLTQHNGNKPQNKISTTQRKQAAKQRN